MMSVTRVVRAVAAGLILVCLPSGAAGADTAADSLALARDLYGAAEYESALGILDKLRGGTASGEQAASVEQYRAFCLMALGRASDAEQAIAAVVHADPTYLPAEAAVSPRMRSTFRDVRARTLPAVIQRQYDVAKAAFDKRDFAVAAVAFAGVLRVLNDPDVAAGATAPPLSDLRTLAAGFLDLSTVAAAPPPPPPAPAPGVAEAAPAPAPPAPAIFGVDDRTITPPVVLRQELPPYPAQLPIGNRGVLELIIDERGGVERAALRVSINPRYDRQVLDAARTWRYEPARRSGVPVKYRKMVQINVRRGE
jgi:TonB family protein